MKSIPNSLKSLSLLIMLMLPAIADGQGSLLGTWKYTYPNGEMIMQIDPSTILINGQSFQYKAQGNVLMINEGNKTTPYPYMLDGDNLTLEWPDGSQFVFTRSTTGTSPGNQQPQNMSNPSTGIQQGPQSTSLSGTYILASGQTTLTLVLNQTASSISGSLTSTTGAGYQLQGQVAQGVGTGVCRGDGSSVFFEAYASGNELTLGLIEPDQSNKPDYNKVQTLVFSRQSGQGSSQNQTGNITGQLFGSKQPGQQDNNMQNRQSDNDQQNYDQGQQGSNLIGTWIFQNQQGQLLLEFKSVSQLTLNGETTQYQLKQGVIQAMGDNGWIDYPYTMYQGVLTITFPDGTQIPFTRSSSAAMNQQGMNQQGTNQRTGGGGSTWQLSGTLCSWSGSSNSTSSYSSTRKLIFDGQGNYQFGREGSFSGDDGLAYSGDPNVETGTYSIGESTVTLYNQSGQTYQFQIKIRENNGTISCIEYEGALYSTTLCE